MKQKSKASKKRKCLSLRERMEVVRYSKDNPGSGYRKIAEHYEIGRTQAQKFLQNKDAIIASYESSASPVQQKRIRVGKYTNVNEALWDWYLSHLRNSTGSATCQWQGKKLTLERKQLKVGVKEQEKSLRDGNLRTFGTWMRLEPFGEDYLSGGKKAKQRNTWAFFVNAAG